MSDSDTMNTPVSAVPQGDDAVWMHHSDLRPWADNPNIHPQFQPEAVAESIRAFGFVAPAVIWRDKKRLVAGHGRLQAMKLICDLGYDFLDKQGEIVHRDADPGFVAQGAPSPGFMRVIFHDFPSEAAANAYAIADNELAKRAHMDPEQVKILLRKVDADASFDALHAIGFPHNELQSMLDDGSSASDFLDSLVGGTDDGPEGDESASGDEGGSNPADPNGDAPTRRETLVDLVIPMSVSERARATGVLNMAKRLHEVTSSREAILAILDHYEQQHAK